MCAVDVTSVACPIAATCFVTC